LRSRKLDHKLEALYITGHSLGAASASMLALMLVTDPAYKPVVEKLKAVYTYGGPMIASREIAADCDEDDLLHNRVIRYVYANDIVPQLPPSESGDFAHFGTGYQYKLKGKAELKGKTGWVQNDAPHKQLRNLLNIFDSPLTLSRRRLQADRAPPVPRLAPRSPAAVLHRGADATGAEGQGRPQRVRRLRLYINDIGVALSKGGLADRAHGTGWAA
jgi:Lipase (class 3)